MTHHEYRKRKIQKTINTSVIVGGLALGLFFYSQIEANTLRERQQQSLNQQINEKFAYLQNKTISYNTATSNVLGAASEVRYAKSVPVLMYHGVVETSDGKEDISWETFKDQMITLKQNGYETISLNELDEFLTKGKAIPEKSFVLTFDDGRKDSFYPVDPILKELDYEAVMFVVTSTINQKSNYHLTEKEYRDMLASGRWELQSHSRNAHKDEVISSDGTKGHWLSNKLWLSDKNRMETDEEYEQRVIADLNGAKEDLESKFKIRVTSLAFPFGDYAQGHTNYPQAMPILLRAAGSIYKFGHYQPWNELGNRNYPGTDTFMIRRYDVEGTWSAEKLLSVVSSSEDKPTGYSSLPSRAEEWITTWGTIQASSEGATLSALPTTSGATAFINGTSTWDNYSMKATVKVGEETSSFSVLMRGDRRGNYAYCTLTKNGVSYHERVNGSTYNGHRWKTDLNWAWEQEVEIGVDMNGETSSCTLDGGTMIKTKGILLKNGNGMIGFSLWSPVNGVGELTIKKVESKSLAPDETI